MEQKDIEKMSVEEIQKLASNISVTDVISMANSIYSNYGNYLFIHKGKLTEAKI